MSLQTAFESTVDPKDWEPYEVGEVHLIRREESEAALVRVGMWRVSPEQHQNGQDDVFKHNVTIHILKGRIRVEIVSGPTVELSPGVIASFVKGTTGRWTIIEPVLAFFIHH